MPIPESPPTPDPVPLPVPARPLPWSGLAITSFALALVPCGITGLAGLLPPGNWNSLLTVEAEALGETPEEVFEFGFGRRAIGSNLAVAATPRSAVREPGRTVLYFEFQSTGWNWNLAGGRELFRPPTRGRPVVIGFVDGSVREIGPDEAARLKWEP